MCHVERSETSDIYLIINNLFGFFAALRMTHNYVHLLIWGCIRNIGAPNFFFVKWAQLRTFADVYKKKRVKGHTYYDLVKSERKSGRPVHVHMLYLGSLSSLEQSQHGELLEQIELLLLRRYETGCSDGAIRSLASNFVAKYYSRQSGHSRKGVPLALSSGDVLAGQGEERILLQSYRTTHVREIGGEWLCWQAIEQLGIRQFLESSEGWLPQEVDVLLMNLLGRLLYPVSERKTALWLEETSGGPGLLKSTASLDDNALHRANAKLLAVHHRLEAHVYGRADELLDFGERHFLYDLTNTYFEGKMAGSSLAQFGRSKEKRSDSRLVSIGLLTNDLGFPKRSDFYAGNVSEPSTFSQVLELVGTAGVLTDAGIGTAENLAAAAQKGVPYMSVSREGFSAGDVVFNDAEAFEHAPSNDTAPYKVWARAVPHTFSHEGKEYKDTLVYVKSEMKANKELAILQRQKERMEKGLEGIRASLSKPTGHKSPKQVNERIGRLKQDNKGVARVFDIKMEQLDKDKDAITAITWAYDASIEKDKGVYVIRTSFEVLSGRQGWEIYHTITQIEATNRTFKTDLNIRPVYHQKDETIKAHLLLTILAAAVVFFIRLTLAKKGINWDWQEIVRVMNTQKVCFSEFNNEKDELILFSHWTAPEIKASTIYKAMAYKKTRNPAFYFKIGVDDS